MAVNSQQSGALANVGGRATLATGAIYVLLLVVLFASLGVILERQNRAAERADTYSRASTQVQKLLRGVNEVTVTEGSSSSRALATEALKDLAELRSRLNASALDQASKIDFSLLQKRVTEFIATQDVSASNVEAMISLGKISTEAGKLSDALARDEVAAADSARRSAQLMRLLLLAAALLALAGTAVIFWMFFRRVTRPLRRAVMVAERVSAGDLSQPIHSIGAGEVTRLMLTLDEMQTNLARLVQEVHETTASVVDSAAQVSAGSSNLSARTETQASTLEETAASMEEFTTGARETATNTKRANDLAVKAAGAARNGGAVVANVVEKISAIQESSKRIAEIIGVIDSIAFQTNILALNAAVEAARAGEQGRGFAVVASEVRALAQRSATAAREIKDLIGTSSAHVESGTALIRQAGTAMTDIVGANEEVVKVIGNITTAAAEQAGGIEQINSAVTQLESTTQQNAALVEQAAAAAESMRERAQMLQTLVERFKLAASQSPLAGHIHLEPAITAARLPDRHTAALPPS